MVDVAGIGSSHREKIHNKFRGVLDDRNNSILAHGWKPVGEQRAENMPDTAQSIAN
ncbi:MAG: hypothetical protein ACRED0_11310 [Gammaproteobacteria bacterium]